MKRIAILTSGGDAPGMNAAVVAVARSAMLHDMRLIGVIRGYNGIIRQDARLMNAFFKNAKNVIGDHEEDQATLCELKRAVGGEMGGDFPDFRPLLNKYRDKFCLADDFDKFLQKYPDYRKNFINLDIDTVLDIADRPGTHLRTARCKPFLNPVVRLIGVINLIAIGVEGLVVIGGDGSFNGAKYLCELGMPCIGIPGTIDNDLDYTEMSLGYDTAVNVCVQAVRQIRATSRSHDRAHVVEVMGRACGDIALRTAVATGAEIVVVPEMPWKIEDVAQMLQKEIDDGNTRTTVVVAEGAYESMAAFDVYGFLMEHNKHCYPGETISAHRLAQILECMCKDSGYQWAEARATVLGYTQRGESPSAADAAFAFEAGNFAVELLTKDKENFVIGITKGKVVKTPIGDALELQKKHKECFNSKLYKMVNRL